MNAQLDLLADHDSPRWYLDPRDETERKFVRFHSENPHIYAELERRALQWLRSKAGRIGVRAIWESIRFDSGIRTRSDDFKLNDHLTALYARLLIHRHPELADVIETRGHR